MTFATRWGSAVQLIYNQTGIAPTSNAKALAWALGLNLCPRRRSGAVLVESDVYYDRTAPLERQQRLVALCVAVYALRAVGAPDDEVSAARVADAITAQRPLDLRPPRFGRG